MAERVRPLMSYLDRETHGFFDDFQWYVTAHLWTSLAADTNSSVAIDADGTGGILVLNTGDNTDNNEVAVRSTGEVFLPAPGKPWELEARIQFTQINTNAANVAFGLMDVGGSANTLLDDGAGVPTSFYGAMIWVPDGATAWRVSTSAGTFSSTGQTTTSVTTAGGSAYQVLTIRGLPVGRANVSEVTFFVDGVQMVDSNGRPIMHELTHGAAGTADGDVFVYCKDGATNNTLTVNVDYVYAAQKR